MEDLLYRRQEIGEVGFFVRGEAGPSDPVRRTRSLMTVCRATRMVAAEAWSLASVSAN